MNSRSWLAAGLVLLVLLSAACDDGGGEAVLGTGGADVLTAGEREGLSLAADPAKILLDACDPAAPTDPNTGKLLGKTTVGAVVLDANLEPQVGVEVVFSSTAGILESAGQPVLTNDAGLATDTLAVDEDDAGEVQVTAVSDGFSDTLTIPVGLMEKPPLTLEVQPAVLWPPNHKMRDVVAILGGLDCGPTPTLELVSVTSNEPDNGIGDGNSVGDIQGAEIGTPDTHFQLRAERSGGGDGRSYTVTYSVAGGEEQQSILTAAVTVPHDQGH